MCDQENDLSSNERCFLRFLHEMNNDSDPKPTPHRVQLLRRIYALGQA